MRQHVVVLFRVPVVVGIGGAGAFGAEGDRGGSRKDTVEERDLQRDAREVNATEKGA